MTQAYIEIDGGQCLLALRDHATGSESVCAGVSALAFALAGYLANAEEHLEEVYTNTVERGKVCIHCKGDAFVEEAFRLTAVGLLQIEAKEPDYIRVDIEEP